MVSKLFSSPRTTVDPLLVFLGADNSVKLGDFGLSKIMQSHDFASTYVGTPFYMSPEICAAERYTLYSDIWSLGCIIYELCAKEPPFNAKTHFDLIQKIKLGRVGALPSVYSAELQKVINTCLRVNPNTRPDTAQLLNLPIVKLMRKEQEVVQLGQQMKTEKELASRALKEANEKVAKLESEKEAMRIEIDASVRREWEVKARLEIDRQVRIELEKLRMTFEAEVSKRVAEGVAKEVASMKTNPAPLQLTTSNHSEPSVRQLARSSTPPQDATHPQESFSTAGSASDFPSGTDLSSLSLESPVTDKRQQELNTQPPKQVDNARATKRPARTPFTRAKTLCVAAVASPMDVQMADPSPMSIASLSLSPRRNGAVQTQGVGGPKRNIFAVAASERWEPEVIDSYPDFSSDDEDLREGADDAADLPPSPTISKRPTGNVASEALHKGSADPFKPLPASRRRPGLAPRQKTYAGVRLASEPTTLFPPTTTNLGPSAAAVRSRPQSTVPIVAASPTRRPPSQLSGGGANAGSPTRKGAAATASNAAVKSRKTGSGDDMARQAMRNGLQGRTLVELSQGRTAAGERAPGDDPAEKQTAGDAGAGTKFGANLTTQEKGAIWDPEHDEMPSPFLVRGTKGVRTALGAR